MKAANKEQDPDAQEPVMDEISDETVDEKIKRYYKEENDARIQANKFFKEYSNGNIMTYSQFYKFAQG